MAIKVAVVNQKGGVGKTTTSLELATQASLHGQKVLVVDLDSQSNTTEMLLFGIEKPELTLFDLLIKSGEQPSIVDVIVPASDSWKNTLLIPSDCRMANVENHLLSRISKERILASYIQEVEENFDYIIFDTSPSIGLLVVNALVAADKYLIPTCLSEYSKHGIQTIQDTVKIVKDAGLNPNLSFAGLLVCRFQKASSKAVKELMKALSEDYGEALLKPVIPDSVKVPEAQVLGHSVGIYAPSSKISVAYSEVYKQLK